MKDIKSMTLAELGTELKVLGEPAFRAKQIYRWMHRGVRDFSEMTDISRSLRERLTAEYTLVSPTVARRLQSQKDGTIKYLWRLMDGNCDCSRWIIMTMCAASSSSSIRPRG